MALKKKKTVAQSEDQPKVGDPYAGGTSLADEYQKHEDALSMHQEKYYKLENKKKSIETEMEYTMLAINLITQKMEEF